MRWRTPDDRRRTTDADGDELSELAALEEVPDEDLLEDVLLAGTTTDASDEPVVNGQLSVVDPALLDEVEQKMLRLLSEIKQFTASVGDEGPIAREVRDKLEAILQLPTLDRYRALDRAAVAEVQAGLADDASIWGSLFGWAFIHALGKITGGVDFAEQSRSWMDEWLLGRIVAGTLRELGNDEQRAALSVMVIKHITSHQSWFETPELGHAYQLLEALLSDTEVQQLLRVNRYQDVLWFDKHAFDRLLWWMLTVAVVSLSAGASTVATDAVGTIGVAHRTITQLRAAAEASGYQVEKLLAMTHE